MRRIGTGRRSRLSVMGALVALVLIAVPSGSGAVRDRIMPHGPTAEAEIESAITKEEQAIEALDRTPPQYYQASRRLDEASQYVRYAEQDSYISAPDAHEDLLDVERLDLAATAYNRFLDPKLWSKAQVEKAVEGFEADIEKAIKLKKKALRLVEYAHATESNAKPVLKPITAVFTQSLYHTVFTEDATGTDLHYTWSVRIPADPGCAAGFKGNTPAANEATWYHADEDIKGPCQHGVRDYGIRGHPGTTTVEVEDAHWSCVATYYGTITGTGPEPKRCFRK